MAARATRKGVAIPRAWSRVVLGSSLAASIGLEAACGDGFAASGVYSFRIH